MSGNYYCCVCGKPATVCKKETINGVTKVSYYCDECLALLENGHPFDNLISAMFNFGGNSLAGVQKQKMRVCKCGMTERDVINNGKFGCSECYNVFRDIVENYVSTRGYLAHKGKAPKQNKATQNTGVEQESERRSIILVCPLGSFWEGVPGAFTARIKCASSKRICIKYIRLSLALQKSIGNFF